MFHNMQTWKILFRIHAFCLLSLLTLTKQSQVSIIAEKKLFENIAGKGENDGNQHFLLFPQCFLNHLSDSDICPLQMFSK